MADSTEKNVWRDMAFRMKDTPVYGDAEGHIAYLDTVLNGKRGLLLDVGCSLGLFDQMFVQAGFNVFGVDQIPEAVEIAKTKVPKATFFVCDATDLPYYRMFDVVFTHTVLQHMKIDPKLATLKGIYAALKKGGVFYMQECLLTAENWPTINKVVPYDDSVSDGYSYTEQGWNTLLSTTGFMPVSVRRNKHWFLYRKT
jgi:SAM-dependent methyltransferase